MRSLSLAVVVLAGCATSQRVGRFDAPDGTPSNEFRSMLEQRHAPDIKALMLIHQAPSAIGSDFDPAALIRAVNGLHELGAVRSLQALTEYRGSCREQSVSGREYGLHEDRIFLICRLLFLRRDGDPSMPPMRIGQPIVRAVGQTDSWPLFPLAVRNDIPFLICGGYELDGYPEDPLVHIQYCRERCVLRASPLRPSSSPVEAVEEITRGQAWSELSFDSLGEPYYREWIRRQALRCLPKKGTLQSDEISDSEWDRYVQQVRRRPVVWESTSNVFKDAFNDTVERAAPEQHEDADRHPPRS